MAIAINSLLWLWLDAELSGRGALMSLSMRLDQYWLSWKIKRTSFMTFLSFMTVQYLASSPLTQLKRCSSCPTRTDRNKTGYLNEAYGCGGTWLQVTAANIREQTLPLREPTSWARVSLTRSRIILPVLRQAYTKVAKTFGKLLKGSRYVHNANYIHLNTLAWHWSAITKVLVWLIRGSSNIERTGDNILIELFVSVELLLTLCASNSNNQFFPLSSSTCLATRSTFGENQESLSMGCIFKLAYYWHCVCLLINRLVC